MDEGGGYGCGGAPPQHPHTVVCISVVYTVYTSKWLTLNGAFPLPNTPDFPILFGGVINVYVDFVLVHTKL